MIPGGAFDVRILLARHGETAWNQEGRYQGQTFDIPLSGTGFAQARALALRLEELELVRAVSSPLLRARQTAETLLGERAGILETDPALMEISHGAWEGRLDSEVQTEDAAARSAWRETPGTARPTDGESLQEVLDRAWLAFRRICEGLGPEENALIVSHDGVNRVLLCQILGLPLSQAWAFRQAPTCLNLLEGPDVDHLVVVRLNDSTHLVPLFGEAVHRRA